MSEHGEPGSQRRPVKIEGWRHAFAAARYSGGGLMRLWQEAAFRHEAISYGCIVVVFTAIGADATAHVGALVLFLLLIAIEALNTAIEELVDRVSPEISSMGQHAKDLGSFAVFCLLLINGIWAAYVVGSHLFGI
ncbi:diacylglycerol kinase [Hoeflea marina]|uniref:Diacylglycerol kinase n=1 Tax=Hoeflea marina TaxID=274592 RepID=A0A317PRH2_9HYPH|nr:diacylglycerol kinase [Hoeflea marina]PWW03335.1 diacylglycerol kinase [Hoeflea marina]